MTELVWQVEAQGCRNRMGELVPDIPGQDLTGLDMYYHWLAFEPEFEGGLLETFLRRLGVLTGFRPTTWQTGKEVGLQRGVLGQALRDSLRTAKVEEYLGMRWYGLRPLVALVEIFLNDPGHYVRWGHVTYNSVHGRYLRQDYELLNREMPEAVIG